MFFAVFYFLVDGEARRIDDAEASVGKSKLNLRSKRFAPPVVSRIKYRITCRVRLLTIAERGKLLEIVDLGNIRR